jgi:hypothetical protein
VAAKGSDRDVQSDPVSGRAPPLANAPAPDLSLPQAIGNAAFSQLVASGSAGAHLNRSLSPRSPATRQLARHDPPDGAAAAAPAVPIPAGAPPENYTLTLSDGEHKNVDIVTAYGLLINAEKSLTKAYDFDFGEWAIVNKERLNFWSALGGSLTDMAGKGFPNYDDNWGPAYNHLVRARHELQAMHIKPAAEALRDANLAYEKAKKEWYAYKAQMDDARFKATVGIVVVAVVAVVVIATAGAAAGAIAGGGGGTGAGATGIAGAEGAGAGAGGTGIAGPSVAGAGAAGALGVAEGGGGAAAAGGAAATAPGVGGATADAIVQAATVDIMAAEARGGAVAVTAVAEGMEVTVLQHVLANLMRALAINPTSTAAGAMLYRVIQILLKVYNRKLGL